MNDEEFDNWLDSMNDTNNLQEYMERVLKDYDNKRYHVNRSYTSLKKYLPDSKRNHPAYTLVVGKKYDTNRGVVDIVAEERNEEFKIKTFIGKLKNGEEIVFSINGKSFDPYTGTFYRADDITHEIKW